MNAITDAPDLLAGLAAFAAAEDLAVGKDGFNKHFNYGYMTEAALFTAARAALAEAGLSGTISFEQGNHEIIPTWNKEGQERPGVLATITARLTIRDRAGNEVSVVAFGQGLDNADKAYYKAMTGAAKYVVQKGLMIAVQGAEDADDNHAGSVAGSSSSSTTTSGVASERQLGFLCSLVKKLHLVESTQPAAVEYMALRMARYQGDSADAFVKISKATASALIEKLKDIPPERSFEVLDKLAAWEAEHGAMAGAANGAAEAAATPEAAPAAGANSDDDIPF